MGTARPPTAHRGALVVDLAFYGASLLFAVATALWSEFSGYRVWGTIAAPGYLLAALCSAWLLCRCPTISERARVAAAAAVVPFSLVAPLAVLLVRRSSGTAWSMQPEVWVVERSALLMLTAGTPYRDTSALGRPPVADDYMPYGPAMAVFGLPSALAGEAACTDARVAFTLVSAVLVALALRQLGWPAVPARAAQLIVACPLTALNSAVGGDDLPVIALLLLSLALSQRRSLAWSGAVAGLALSIKLTALPPLVILAASILVGTNMWALCRFAAAAAGVCAVIVVPVLAANPAAFVEHVLRFPAGLAAARSPAASPLPGHLIASTGPTGHLTALALLGVAAVGVAVWLAVRPPKSTTDAALRAAVALGAATLLAPATRFGYLIYPAALVGAMILFSSANLRSCAERSVASC
jgi:hypothetical protein